jgi:hypothetical protein
MVVALVIAAPATRVSCPIGYSFRARPHEGLVHWVEDEASHGWSV